MPERDARLKREPFLGDVDICSPLLYGRRKAPEAVLS
jgi:hypothetical protein